MRARDISVEWLRSKCEVDEETGCWLWHGNVTTDARQPQATIRTPEGRKTVLVRRVVWELVHERKLRRNMWAFAPCDEKHGREEPCVCPEHINSRTRSKAQRGVTRPALTKLRIAMAKRAASTVDHEAIRKAIAETSLKNVHIAAQVGCHHSLVARIRNGQRRDYASPFAGLAP